MTPLLRGMVVRGFGARRLAVTSVVYYSSVAVWRALDALETAERVRIAALRDALRPFDWSWLNFERVCRRRVSRRVTIFESSNARVSCGFPGHSRS